MIQLIYASAATVEFTEEDLQQLLSGARQKNSDVNVTGMLVYHNGSFLQILEGEEEDVLELYDRIEKDPRHDNVRMLLRSEIEERSFGEWQMGFCDVSGNSRRNAGFIDFFRRGFRLSAADGDRAKSALMRFREGGWRQHVTA